MKKKGFTLIELLAVIVILGIISIITVSIISDEVSSSKKESFELGVQNTIESAKKYILENFSESDFPSGGIDVTSGVLKLKNNKYISGIIKKDSNGLIVVENISDGTYCSNGSRNNLKTIKGDCSTNDKTSPEVKLKLLENKSNSLIYSVTMADSGSGIKEYNYCYQNCENEKNWKSREYTKPYPKKEIKEVITLKELVQNKKYTLKVKVINGNKKETELINEEGLTKTIEEAKFKLSSSNYSGKKEVTIIYPDYQEGYIYSYEYNGNVKKIESGKTEVKFEVSQKGIVIAKIEYIENGERKEIVSKLNIVNIDDKGLEQVEVVITPKDEWSKIKKVTINTSKEGSGLAYKAYKFGNDEWTNSKEKIYNKNTKVKIKVRDKLGNETTTFNNGQTELVVDKIDTEPATCSISVSGETKEINGNVWYTERPTMTVTYKDYYIDVDGKKVEGGSGVQDTSKMTLTTGTSTKEEIVTINENKYITTLENGMHSVLFNIKDKVGNNEGSCSTTIYVDSVQPVIEAKQPENTVIYQDDKNLLDEYFLVKNNYGSLGGSTICYIVTPNKLDEKTNNKDLPLGKHKIKCVMLGNNGKRSEAETIIKHTQISSSDDYFCLSNDDDISDNCIFLDETKIKKSVTTDSLTIDLGEGFATDEEVGIKGYEYIINKDGKQEISGFTTDTKYTFKKLIYNTEYEIIIKVINNKNKVTEVNQKVKTLNISKPTISYVNTPSTLQNGYLKKQVATVTYVKGNIVIPTYYVKTTREGISNLQVTKSCGTGTTPDTICTTITSTTNLAANTWYQVSGNVSITYTAVATSTGIIYAAVGDGTNFSIELKTLDKIDTTGPNLTLSTASTTTNSITIPITASDAHSGLDEVICKYSTTSGSYTTNASSVSTTSCSLTGLTKGTTYYYQVCISDKVANKTCETGSAETGVPSKPMISYQNTPSTTQNGYLKKQVATITYINAYITNPTYYVKTTRSGTSSLTITKSCGTGTTPDTTCTTITSTTSLAANTWYQVSGDVSVTYDTEVNSKDTIYAVIADDTGNLSETLAGTLDRIDTTSPNVILGTPTTSSDSITIPVTSSDSESGVVSATCKYSSTSGSYTTNASSVSTTSCSLTGLTKGTTYYYQVCVNDKVNNSTCKTGSATTGTPSKPTITYTNTPSTIQNGYLKKQIVTIEYSKGNVENPTYYVKTTRAGTSNLEVIKACGTGTTPDTTCETITNTTSLTANTWYQVSGNVSVTYNTASEKTGTIYAAVSDYTGNLSEVLAATIDKIDTLSSIVSLRTPITSNSTITIPITSSDAHSGLGTATCKYSTTSGSYTINATSASTTSCSLTGLTKGTTYYYQICISDKVGNTATCKTGSATTENIEVELPIKPIVSYTNTPNTLQNGYLKKQIVTIEYSKGSIANPIYYVKTSRPGVSSLAVTKWCGIGTNPGTCSEISSMTNLTGNTWYQVSDNVSITYSNAANSPGTIYAAVGDGNNLSEVLAEPIDKIDTASPSVILSTPISTSNSITIPITSSDEHSGLGTATCKYSTTDGSYTIAASSVSTTSCSLTGLEEDKIYYYQVCITDKVGNIATCKTGSARTEVAEKVIPTKPTISYENTPSTIQNGYLRKQIATITYVKGNVTNPIYYVKTSRPGVSSLSVTKSCGTGTNPGECSTIISTKNLAVNTWYQVSGNVSITYSAAATSTGIIYAAVGDGTNLSEILTETIDKIDITNPSVTLSTESTTTNSITIPITTSDEQSGLDEVICYYSTEEGNYTVPANSVNTTSCSLKNLRPATTYYYQICVSDKVGNEVCETGSAETKTILKPTINYVNTPSELQNGYLKKQVATVTYVKGSVENPTYYVKTTRQGTSSLAVTKSCGTGTNPGTCTTITSTTRLAANTWYQVSGNVSVTYEKQSDIMGTISAAVGDGNNFAIGIKPIDKIDPLIPRLTLSTESTTTNSITIPITASDVHSGLDEVICKYSTTSGSYTINASSVSTTSCSLTGLTKGTTYYYQVCISDKVANKTCETGSAETGVPSKPMISYQNTPSTTQNGYLKKQVATITYISAYITNPTYYVKTTRSGTSSLTITKSCGTGTTPDTTCTTITSTKRLAANTWYQVSGDVSVTYDAEVNSKDTIYAVIADDTGNLSETLAGTIDRIDTTSPSVTLSTPTTSTNSITIPITASDSESGVSSATCKYSSTSGSYTTTASSSSTTSCNLTGLAKGTAYYYQVCIYDKVNNSTCKTGSATTGTPTKPTMTYANTTNPGSGLLQKQVVTITYTKGSVTNPIYYVKTTRAGTSSLAVTKSCGTGTNPGTCSTITSTTSLSANTWYQVSGNVSVTYSTAASSTGTIYAAVGDGTNLSETAAGTIDKIDTNVYVTGVSLNQSTGQIHLNTNSKTLTLTATVAPSNATNKTVTWKSSNTDIATVSNGVVTAVNPGVVTITATTADGGKVATATITVNKNVIIIIGASQVTRMVDYNKNTYSSSKYNYKTSDNSLIYVNKSGSGIPYQTNEGFNIAKANMDMVSVTGKAQVNFYIFFPLSGNTIRNFTCSEISKDNTKMKKYVEDYVSTITNLVNNGYNAKGYIVSMHPVRVSQAGDNDKVVTNENANSCAADYRSNRKYYKFNVATKNILSGINTSYVKYESIFRQIMEIPEDSNKNYSYKITYNTTDGVHWDSATTHTYVDMMLNYSGDL